LTDPVVDGHGPSSAAALATVAVGGDPSVVVSIGTRSVNLAGLYSMCVISIYSMPTAVN